MNRRPRRGAIVSRHSRPVANTPANAAYRSSLKHARSAGSSDACSWRSCCCTISRNAHARWFHAALSGAIRREHLELPLLRAMRAVHLRHQKLEPLPQPPLLQQPIQHVGLGPCMRSQSEPQPVQNVPSLLGRRPSHLGQSLIQIPMIPLDESEHIDPHAAPLFTLSADCKDRCPAHQTARNIACIPLCASAHAVRLAHERASEREPKRAPILGSTPRAHALPNVGAS